MAVVFKGFQSQIADKEGQKLFYPRVMLTGNVGTDLIAAEIAELSSLTKGDTKNVIDNLIIVATRHLQASESVTLDGFGTFRPTFVLAVPRVFEKVYNTAKQKAHGEGKGKIFDAAEKAGVAIYFGASMDGDLMPDVDGGQFFEGVDE